ncbi:MAG: SUMF1/EgtB/PvdO family nonheme iron enzyme [Candidatus Pacebacteria bacterium]|nr:SUMF1/EgtB/PvdO family nonheme iron enzyme [Candidatus Paceibacterota bacterium]MDD5357304.1 SUMF1/EgtB/PvdO family nonheme iron enzyme [Candidatus Paceibacterota bacterium]
MKTIRIVVLALFVCAGVSVRGDDVADKLDQLQQKLDTANGALAEAVTHMFSRGNLQAVAGKVDDALAFAATLESAAEADSLPVVKKGASAFKKALQKAKKAVADPAKYQQWLPVILGAMDSGGKIKTAMLRVKTLGPLVIVKSSSVKVQGKSGKTVQFKVYQIGIAATTPEATVTNVAGIAGNIVDGNPTWKKTNVVSLTTGGNGGAAKVTVTVGTRFGSGFVFNSLPVVLSPVSTPTFSLPGGVYTTGQSVTIDCATAGATIYYTTDGSIPTPSSSVYTGAIAFGSTTTIKAIALKDIYSDSAVASATYTIQLVQVASPTFSLPTGIYQSGQSVTISCATAGATIYYTTDGSVPTASSLQYTSPVSVGNTTMIRAIALENEMLDSAVGRVYIAINSIDLGNGVKLELVHIPAGSFMMGSPETEIGHDVGESPRHQVTISHAFFMGKFTVTQSQYTKVMGNNPSHFIGSENPVETMGFEGAQAFCAELKAMTGLDVRLPTEAEWEYSCRAGTTTAFYAGDSSNNYDDPVMDSIGWYDSNSATPDYQPGYGTTHPVGQKLPNAFGLYDMSGNVWQYCQDWFDVYQADAVTDPQGPAFNPAYPSHVLRGGYWWATATTCRSATRSYLPDIGAGDYGFRVVVNAP